MPGTSLRFFSVVQERTIQLLTIFTIITLTACASAPERHAVPAELITQANISGIPEARFWADEWPKFSEEKFANFTISDFQKYFSSIYDKPHNYLAISGGGPNGAFGAGLLIGWTKTGTRPEFTMVTGVSTGALSAPLEHALNLIWLLALVPALYLHLLHFLVLITMMN
jgi:hypothetical protein